MFVKGYAVPQEVIDACLVRMKQGLFRAENIENTAAAKMFFVGKSECASDDDICRRCGICHRIADRLIQRERQAKRIKKADKYPYWVWCGEQNKA